MRSRFFGARSGGALLEHFACLRAAKSFAFSVLQNRLAKPSFWRQKWLELSGRGQEGPGERPGEARRGKETPWGSRERPVEARREARREARKGHLGGQERLGEAKRGQEM